LITERQLEDIARSVVRKNRTKSAALREAVRQIREQLEHDLHGEAFVVMQKHKPEKQGSGCSCGFCMYSVEHVVLMFANHIAERR
jgi:hypothetical protein